MYFPYPPQKVTGEWTHVVVTHNGSNVKLYVDGKFVDEADLQGNQS